MAHRFISKPAHAWHFQQLFGKLKDVIWLGLLKPVSEIPPHAANGRRIFHWQCPYFGHNLPGDDANIILFFKLFQLNTSPAHLRHKRHYQPKDNMASQAAIG